MNTFLLRGRVKTDPEFVLVFLVAIVLVLIISYYFSKKNRVLRALKKSRTKFIVDFTDGDTGKFVGNVVLTGDSIYAPMSKRKCVFYHVIVEQYYSGKHSGWRKVMEEEQKATVVIHDGSGYALVDAENSLAYLVPDESYTMKRFESATPELEKLLARNNVDTTDFFGFNRRFRYFEGVLQKGELFAVSGEGQWNETKDHQLNLPDEKVLVLIAEKGEQELYISDDPEAVGHE